MKSVYQPSCGFRTAASASARPVTSSESVSYSTKVQAGDWSAVAPAETSTRLIRRIRSPGR
ncbi:hypothetical protein AB0D71_10385 [Streptomyces avermitilis]|uniref:hypothetical protein n=1 Tax=Streptomyces avermitilis TaxID=33903 RepID=UPI0033ECB10B